VVEDIIENDQNDDYFCSFLDNCFGRFDIAG